MSNSLTWLLSQITIHLVSSFSPELSRLRTVNQGLPYPKSMSCWCVCVYIYIYICISGFEYIHSHMGGLPVVHIYISHGAEFSKFQCRSHTVFYPISVLLIYIKLVAPFWFKAYNGDHDKYSHPNSNRLN